MVVSSAYKLSLVILFPFSRSLINSVILIWLASGSTAKTRVFLKEGIPVLLLFVKKKFWGVTIANNTAGNVLVESMHPVKETWAKLHVAEHLEKIIPFLGVKGVLYPLYFHVFNYIWNCRGYFRRYIYTIDVSCLIQPCQMRKNLL